MYIKINWHYCLHEENNVASQESAPMFEGDVSIPENVPAPGQDQGLVGPHRPVRHHCQPVTVLHLAGKVTGMNIQEINPQKNITLFDHFSTKKYCPI